MVMEITLLLLTGILRVVVIKCKEELKNKTEDCEKLKIA